MAAFIPRSSRSSLASGSLREHSSFSHVFGGGQIAHVKPRSSKISLTGLQSLPPLFCGCCTCCSCLWSCISCYNKKNFRVLCKGSSYAAAGFAGWGLVRLVFNLYQAFESAASPRSLYAAIVLKSFETSVVVDVILEPFWSVAGLLHGHVSIGLNSKASVSPVYGLAATFKIALEIIPAVLLAFGATKFDKSILQKFLILMLASLIATAFEFVTVTLYLVLFPTRITFTSYCGMGQECYKVFLIYVGLTVPFWIIGAVKLHIFMCGYALSKQRQIRRLERLSNNGEQEFEEPIISLTDPNAFLVPKGSASNIQGISAAALEPPPPPKEKAKVAEKRKSANAKGERKSLSSKRRSEAKRKSRLPVRPSKKRESRNSDRKRSSKMSRQSTATKMSRLSTATKMSRQSTASQARASLRR